MKSPGEIQFQAMRILSILKWIFFTNWFKGLRFITGRKFPVFLETKKTVEMDSLSQGDTSVTAPLEITFLNIFCWPSRELIS